MRIITKKFIEQAKQKHPDARAQLDHWHKIAKSAHWKNFAETRLAFSHADQVTVKSKRTVTIFNISNNDFRLITAIHYNKQKVHVMRFLTHAEYDKNKWMEAL